MLAAAPTHTALVPPAIATAAPTMTPASNTPMASTTRVPFFLPSLVNCEGASPSRLGVGTDVFINLQLSLPLRLRQAAGLDAAILDRNLAGTQMEVIGGPECADGYTWWQVREKDGGNTGWSAEGTFNELYLIPSELIAYRDQYTLRTYAMSIITLLSPNGTVLYRPVNGLIGAWDISHDSQTIAYGMYTSLAWSSDAQSVAFLGDQLLIFDVITGRKRALTDTPNHSISLYRSNIEYVSFSPDGHAALVGCRRWGECGTRCFGRIRRDLVG